MNVLDNRKLMGLLGAVLAAGAAAIYWAQREPGALSGNVEITMTAKNFQFEPREIRLVAGAHVRLRVRSLDDAHGIAFKVVPIGQPEGSPAGLLFSTHKPDWELQPGVEQVIDFTAEKPGRYSFACSVFCGMGHNGMVGRIVVLAR
jgi:cytochrome c oxidase subunit 2